MPQEAAQTIIKARTRRSLLGNVSRKKVMASRDLLFHDRSYRNHFCQAYPSWSNDPCCTSRLVPAARGCWRNRPLPGVPMASPSERRNHNGKEDKQKNDHRDPRTSQTFENCPTSGLNFRKNKNLPGIQVILSEFNAASTTEAKLQSSREPAGSTDFFFHHWESSSATAPAISRLQGL